MSGHPDRKATHGPSQFDELEGMGELALPRVGIGGRVPPKAMRFSIPALRNDTRISASSKREWATQIRCAMGKSVVVRNMPATRSWVRWRDSRPPR